MRVSELNWFQVEERLRSDDRCVVPLGCTEQHAFLSLATDSILAERVALEAAEPLGVPVFPVVPFGVTPAFLAYPGTVSIRLTTYCRLIEDVLDSLERTGFRRILIVNGHGGNTPARSSVAEWAGHRSHMSVRWHDWWNAPRTWAKVIETDPVASHASWMENFPWTRLAGVVQPTERKPMVDYARVATSTPDAVRNLLGDGNFGGHYERPEPELQAIWSTAVQETRDILASIELRGRSS